MEVAKKDVKFGKLKIIGIILLIILLSIIITAFVIGIPMLMTFIFKHLLRTDDGYLLMGFSFYIFVIMLIILITIIFFLLMTKKKQRLKALKLFFRNYKALAYVILSIILLFVFIFYCFANTYYKDIKAGEQIAIMTDAQIKIKRSHKSRNTYVIGYIDGKKVQLKVTHDARSRVKYKSSFEEIEIKYYKHLKEVYVINVKEK